MKTDNLGIRVAVYEINQNEITGFKELCGIEWPGAGKYILEPEKLQEKIKPLFEKIARDIKRIVENETDKEEKENKEQIRS